MTEHQQRAPYDLWHDALAEYPDDPAARSLRYLELMIEHGYIEELEQAVPIVPSDDSQAER